MSLLHTPDLDIAYLDAGRGDPIVLVHGFASTKEVNWVNPGWVDVLVGAGRRVVALDNRGHGASTRLYDPALYDTRLMAGDVLRLMDRLHLPRADVMGYSMGARITAFLAAGHPERVRSAVLGGLGSHLVDGVGLPMHIADALEAPALADVKDRQGRIFRRFAEQTGGDRGALAACIRGSRQVMPADVAASLSVPVLVAVGSKDDVAGSGRALAELIPGAEFLDIPNRDHMLAVGDKAFKAGVLDFLERRP